MRATLGLLGKSLLLAVLTFAQGLGKTVPDIKPKDKITGAHAIAIGHEILGDTLPAIATEPLSHSMRLARRCSGLDAKPPSSSDAGLG